MSIQEKCKIVRNNNILALPEEKEVNHYYEIELVSPYISSHAEPGQFVNVKCSEYYDPLLRRPFSFHKISKEHKTFTLLYEVIGTGTTEKRPRIGKGTKLLSQAKIGTELDILGPLGRGFEIDKDKPIAILVGGGMGVAPLLALAEQLKQNNKVLYILIGGQTREQTLLFETMFNKISDQISISTVDGTCGKKGLISNVLLDTLNTTLDERDLDQTTLYACGPNPMLKAVADIAFQKKIPAQLSMEQRMACGIGTCLGCVIKTKDGYKKVCDEGPVFDSREIIW